MLPDAIPPDSEFILWFGHADSRGDESTNFELGRRRAETIYLATSAGGSPAPQARLLVASFGESWPLALGNFAQAFDENRRVDVYSVVDVPEATEPLSGAPQPLGLQNPSNVSTSR
jgi:flagellar motor protein MotB